MSTHALRAPSIAAMVAWAVLAGVLAAVIRMLTGCTPPRPDALAIASSMSNATAIAIDEATRRHEAALERAILAGAADCPHEPRISVPGCQQQAAAVAERLAAPELVRLIELAMLQRRVTAGLRAAQQCRRDELDCEAAQVAAVEGSLAAARALLRQLGGTPAPPTSDGGTP